MEKKTKYVPKFKTVKDGTKAVIEYIANDGKKFEKEEDCLKHEASLLLKEEAEKNIQTLNFDDNEVVANILFEIGFDAQYTKLFKFKLNKSVIEKQVQFLIKLGMDFFRADRLLNFIDGEEIIACVYEEYTNAGDYKYNEFMNFEAAKEKFEEFKNKTQSVLNSVTP